MALYIINAEVASVRGSLIITVVVCISCVFKGRTFVNLAMDTLSAKSEKVRKDNNNIIIKLCSL